MQTSGVYFFSWLALSTVNLHQVQMNVKALFTYLLVYLFSSNREKPPQLQEAYTI
jgi:hypothetical protein